MLGLGGFTLASMLCGLAPSVMLLIVARLAQGVTGAVMFPQVLAMLRAQIAAERRGFAFALLGIVWDWAAPAASCWAGVWPS
ncbi:MAG: major facilitator superfamily protein [Rhodospirillales bacterium]|nr:major facilitator superfamily protein [Rhodospirillales bacterium]